MALYCIYMDQGLVVDLSHDRVCSGQFSNCAPIVFYNDHTKKAGLYHLAGCSELEDYQEEHLKQLVDLVDPTVIYVLRGDGKDDALFAGMGGDNKGHVRPVMSFLEKLNMRSRQRFKMRKEFLGKKSFSSLTVSMVGGLMKIGNGYSSANSLTNNERIKRLPARVTFIGERDGGQLSKWI